MKIAHLLMVHKNASQVKRLLHALAHEHFDFYIHLDAKVNFEDYAHLMTLPGVRFIRHQHAVRWASYRFVEAINQGLREILASGVRYDFINLLSGQDYPLKPAETIYRFFAQHKGYSFLSYERQGSAWWRHAINRVERYHTDYYTFKFQYRLQKIANKLLPKRRFPLPVTLYGGPCCSWWTLSAECAAYVVNFFDQHAALRRFSQLTWGPDEFLVATILMNSPLKDRIVNDNHRYIDWSGGGANPKVLTLDDAEELKRSHKLFARKFDATQDAAVLDVIDDSLATLEA